MDSKQKQSAIIGFVTKEGCRVSNTHRRPQNVHSNGTTDKSNVLSFVTFVNGVISANTLQPSANVRQPAPPSSLTSQ